MASNIIKVTSRLFEMANWMVDLGISLLCQRIMLNPKAQAPEILVFMIPAGVNVLPSRDILKEGSMRKRRALMKINIEEMVATPLNFMVTLPTNPVIPGSSVLRSLYAGCCRVHPSSPPPGNSSPRSPTWLPGRQSPACKPPPRESRFGR